MASLVGGEYMGCKQCGCEEITFIDEGIGAYEYWGSMEVQVDMVPVCAECGEYVETTIGFHEWKQDQMADNYA